jgi:hypothetical protein
MRSLVKVLIYLCILVFFLSGCAKGEHLPSEEEPATTEIRTTVAVTTAPEPEPEPVDDSLQEGQAYSPLNGTIIQEEKAQLRPIGIMYDNHPSARPQAGMIDADVIYEIRVEGVYTRYFALHQSVLPEDIGSVRSARSYFVLLAKEYDSLFAHIGGSVSALNDIKRLNVGDIEGLKLDSSVFWRKKHKPIPNNMYTSGEALLKLIHSRNFHKDMNVVSWDFGTNDLLASAETLHSPKIVYKAPSGKDSIGYFVEFVYNEERLIYDRFVNGKPHLDEASREQLYAKSILIQKAKTKVIDSEGRLQIDLVGEGTGYYLAEGKVMPITWKKATEAARTVFYDAQGNPLVMVPGKLWVQVVPSDFQLQE